MEDDSVDSGEDYDQDQDQPRPNLTRNKVAPRDLINRVVYNSRLIPMPTTIPGSSTQQQDVVDEEEHVDEVIRDVDILDPQKYLLVDRHGRVIIMPHATDLQPHKKATSAITYIIQANYHEPWLNWTEIKQAKIEDEPLWNTFWNAFKAKCTWLADHEDMIMKIFNHKCSRRLSDLLVDARKLYRAGKNPPKWLGDANGNLWKTLTVKWDTEEYKKKCTQAKQNRAVQPNASLHTGGSTSSSTLRIRFEREFGRKPTMNEMNELLHRKGDGTWDSERAERASTMIKKYIKKLKASEAALPPEQRKSDEVLQNQILDKFVEYSGGKKKGHIQGQGCTSSFIQRTPAGYMDVSSQSFSSSSSMSTGRSAPVESREEFEQRLRAEHQQSMAKLREDLMAEWEQRVQGQHQSSNSFSVSHNLGNQSNQQQPQHQQQRQQHQSYQQNLQRQQHQSYQQNQSDHQRQLQQHRRPPVQQNQAFGRNPLSSSHQQDQFHEDEYRPQNDVIDTNQIFEPDSTFFEGLQNDPLLQSMMMGDGFEPFMNASHNDPAGWNQGGEIPFSSPGINYNQSGGNTFINQRGARTLGIIQGGSINEFNAGNRRASGDGSSSGGRTSGGVGGRARGRSSGRTSGNA